MAFGGLKGTLTGNGGSIGTSNAITGSVVVAVGDIVWVAFGQQTNLTATSATDNLNNTYSAQNAGTDAGAATGRCFWTRVTNGGTLTQVTVAASSSTNDWCGLAAVIEGPFPSSPLDANATNITSDVTSPFTCPTTGTLAQAHEVVIAWGAASYGTTWAASSPNLLAGNANNASNIKVAIGYQKVTATTAVAPEFTAASNPSVGVLGTASFKGVYAGSIARTTAATTSSASGKVIVKGSVAKTLANATSEASGKVIVKGSVAKTTADATSSASGTVQNAVRTGTIAATTGATTSSASGKGIIKGQIGAAGPAISWDPDYTHANITLSEGNLRAAKTSAPDQWDATNLTADYVLPDKGCFEFKGLAACTHITIGLYAKLYRGTSGHPGTSSALWYLNAQPGANDSSYWSERWTGGDLTTDDVGMVAWDLTQGRIWFGINGLWLGDGDPAAIQAQFQPTRTHSSCTLSAYNRRAHFSSTGASWRATAVQDGTANGEGGLRHYFTFKLLDPGSANSNNLLVGICRAADFNKDSMWASGAAWMLNSPGSGVGGGWTYQSGGDYPSNTDYNCVAIDLDAGKIWWGNGGGAFPNGGNPNTGANPQLLWTGTGNASDYDDWIIFVAASDDGGLTLRDVRIYPDETGGYNVFNGNPSMWSWAGAKYHWVHASDDLSDYDWTIKCGIYGDYSGSGYDGDLKLRFGVAPLYDVPSGYTFVGEAQPLTTEGVSATGAGKAISKGSAAATTAAATSAASGKVRVKGDLAATTAATTSEASGTAEQGAIAGTITATTGAATSAASGKVRVKGDLAATTAAATAAASGKVRAVGTVAVSTGAALSAASGKVITAGSLAATTGAASSVASGKVISAGALAALIANVNASASGKVRGVGTLATTTGATTSVAYGAVGGAVVFGSVNVTTAAATSVASGAVRTHGTLARTTAPATSVAAGLVRSRGSVAVTTGNVTAAATGISYGGDPITIVSVTVKFAPLVVGELEFCAALDQAAKFAAYSNVEARV